MTQWVEQSTCLKFCVKLEYSSSETILMIQKATSMGNWWLAASSEQCAFSYIMPPAGFFGETSNRPGGSSPPLQPRFGALQLLAFPKTKVTFERKEISDCQSDSGKYKGTADSIGRTVWGPKVLLWRELRHHFPMYNVSYILYLLQ